MVYIRRKNIRTKRQTDKLDYKKIRLFKIKEKISNVNFQVKLLDYIKIYKVFYISLLKLAKRNIRELYKLELVKD